MIKIDNKISYLIFASLILGLFFTTPKILLFYDAPEYVDIVNNNGFLRSMTLGHIPIHPIFMAFLWATSRGILSIFNTSWSYTGNLSAFVFGLVSLLSFYKLTGLFFSKNIYRLLSLVIFSVFPLVWIINTNLMVESLMLPFFIGGVYFFRKLLLGENPSHKYLYITIIFILIAAHIQTLFWVPAIFGVNFLQNEKISLKNIKKLALYTLVGIFIGLTFYLLIYFLTGKPLLESLINLLFGHHAELSYRDPIGYLRIIRNIFLTVARGFGVLSVLLIIYFVFRDIRDKQRKIGWGLLLLAIAVEGAFWTGDYMQRRQVYLGVVLALIYVKRFRMKSIWIIVYLVLMIIPNILLYSSNMQDMPLFQLQYVANILPKDEVYVQSNYVSPFVNNYDGKLVWVDGTNPEEVNELLKNDRVFIDSQGIKSPYYIYSGNNYHITSLAKIGESPAKKIIANNNLCFYSNYGEIVVYEIKKPGDECEYDIQLEQKIRPGEPIVFNSTNPLERVNRRRVDYGDVFTWLWYLSIDKQDTLDWTFADVDGDIIYVNGN